MYKSSSSLLPCLLIELSPGGVLLQSEVLLGTHQRT